MSEWKWYAICLWILCGLDAIIVVAWFFDSKEEKKPSTYLTVSYVLGRICWMIGTGALR